MGEGERPRARLPCVGNTPPINHFNPVVLRSYRASDTATAGQVLIYEVVASDPEGSALSFSWEASTGSLGTPASDASHSRVTWTAPSCVSAGTPPAITATVTNAFHLTATRSFSVTGLPVCSTSGSWAMTGPMTGARYGGHIAVLLPNGKVLVAGGYGAASTEVYDPGSDTWSPTGSMGNSRYGYTATLLPNGKVLVIGTPEFTEEMSESAELYTP